MRTSKRHSLKRIKGGRRGPVYKYHYGLMIFIWAQFEDSKRIHRWIMVSLDHDSIIDKWSDQVRSHTRY